MKPILISGALALLFASCSKEEAATPVNPEPEVTTEMAASTDVEPYPLDVCIVSGEELGSMGEPITVVHEGREIKFCCKECQPKFEEDPDKYLSKLEQ